MAVETRTGFPVAFATIPLGGLLFATGVVLLGVERSQPNTLARLADLPSLIAPALIVGGILLCIGLGAVVLGWGNGLPRRPLPAGSHRSILATTLFALVSTGVVAAVYLVLVPGVSVRSAGTFTFLALALDMALIGMVFLQGVRPGFLSITSLGLSPRFWGTGVAWGLLGAGLMLLPSVANNLVLQALGLQQPQRESLAWLADLPREQFLLVALAGAVAAPLAEELYFRGYVFNAYLLQKGEWVAYAGSALLFGVLHGEALLLLAFVTMGLILAYLYRRTGTIIAPIVSHTVNNSLAFLALLALPGS